MRVLWVVIVQIVVLSGSLLAAGAADELGAKAAKHFTVQWSSVRYDKAVVENNPAIFSTRQETSENLTLTCQIKVQDPDLVLGTGQFGVITQVTDDKGQDAAVNASAAPRQRMYERLRYHRQFRRPSVPKWRAFIRKILGHPPQPAGPPQLVDELQPSTLQMGLDMGLLDQAGGELRSVKGYFHALVAGSVEHVDVPFEPNSTWVRLTPDVQVCVSEAFCTDRSFRYRVESRPQGGGGGRPLTIGEPVPSRFVVAQQLIGEDGKPAHSHFMGGGMLMPGHVGGSGTGSGTNCRIKAFRFLIAVNAADRKIPFELQRVPLPKP